MTKPEQANAVLTRNRIRDGVGAALTNEWHAQSTPLHLRVESPS